MGLECDGVVRSHSVVYDDFHSREISIPELLVVTKMSQGCYALDML